MTPLSRFCRFALLGIFVLALLGVAAEAFSQDAAEWPTYQVGKTWRGPGWYFSLVKIFLAWGLFLLWVRTSDWVNTECQEYKFRQLRWNAIVVGPFFGAFVFLWLLPWYWLGYFLLLAAYATPLTMFILFRNKTVDPSERVLTQKHFRSLLSRYGRFVGMKVAAEPADPHAAGPPVRLTPRSDGTGIDIAPRLSTAQQSAGFRNSRQIVADGFARRATSIMLEFTQTSVGVRHLIDSVWVEAEPLTRETADPALESLKVLCGLLPQERQKRQEGAFAAHYENSVRPGTFTSQGIATGERVVLQFDVPRLKFQSLDDMGMRTALQEVIKKKVEATTGLLLFSAMPASGLRSTVDRVLRGADRFTREFASFEDSANRYEEIENVAPNTFTVGGEEPPKTGLMRVIRTEPNVIVARDLVDADMTSLLCRFAMKNGLVITTIRARDSVEALLRVLALKVPPAEFAGAVSIVVNQRLVRKLCEKCKEAYTPAPDVLKQLGIPAGRVTTFYRPPQPPPPSEEPKKSKEKPEVCPVCHGVGYFGRTAIFELLEVDDNVRKALISQPKLETIRQAAQNAGMHSLLEEGLLLAAKGVTSIPELMRVLK